MFTSPTYGPVSMERMIELLREFYDRNKGYDCPFNVTVGTDRAKTSIPQRLLLVS